MFLAKQYWSPEQIAGRLKRYHKIDVSPVTIYSWIKRDKAEGGRLYKFLRQSHRKRRKRYGSCEKRGQIPDRRSIDQRPRIVNERKRIGDWESDTVVGQGRGSYFANAYHSWERGTNENTNGLLRQFFPKGTDFHQVSQWRLDKIEKLLTSTMSVQ